MGAKKVSSSFGLGRWAAPWSFVYTAFILVRRWLYDSNLAPQNYGGVRTISVGGLEVGGSGKTPVTQFILKKLIVAGEKPGLLTRGYGRKSKGLEVRGVGQLPDPIRIGDEPAMLVTQGLNIPVAACAKRIKGANSLVRFHECTVLVLDDGFAHRALKRDLDIVVLRGEAPLGNGHLLPRGSLREPVSSLDRAGILWFHYKSYEQQPIVPDWVSEKYPEHQLVLSRTRTTVPVNIKGQPINLKGERILVAAGIAHPDAFFEGVQQLGAGVVCTQAFADHHHYTQRDVNGLIDKMRTCEAHWVVVTQKDAVKLKQLWPDSRLVVVGIQVEIIKGEDDLVDVISDKELVIKC